MIKEAVIVTLSVVGAEIAATAIHRYVMHSRYGWTLHRDHHETHDGLFERNDLFSVFFAATAVAMMWLATPYWPPLYWIGVGVTIYGVLYFIVHDGLVHQRWPFRYVPRRGFLRRLYQAHRLHHATRGREDGVSFGFLYAAPVEQLKRQLSAQRGRAHKSLGRGAATGMEKREIPDTMPAESASPSFLRRGTTAR